MIKSVYINNFQSHKDTNIDFSEKVNVIIGPSDQGKSAIIRAINWVFNNRPSGDAFRSNWGGDTEVNLELSEEHEISRIKAKGKNTYQYYPYGSDTDVEIYKAMGQDVPKEIQEVLNISELNLQKQMEAPFLLSSTAGEVSRYLNQIVNLDAIDKSLSYIEKKKKKYREEKVFNENELEKLREEVKQFKDLDKIEALTDDIANYIMVLDIQADRYKCLEELISDIEELSAVEVDAVPIQDVKKLIAETKIQQNHFVGLKKQYTDIYRIVKEIEDNESGIDDLDYTNVNSLVSDCRKYQGHIETSERNKSTLERIIRNIKEGQEKQSRLLEEVAVLKDKRNHLMPDVCPLCGTELGGNHDC